MRHHAETRCDQHPDRFDCADNLIYRDTDGSSYGLIVHDGGSSYIAISYCPWCGASLPTDEGQDTS
jgi:hypothetical protein